MAHVGKNYPVHFSRDMCLGILNHRQGFPRHWLINSTLTGSAPPFPVWQQLGTIATHTGSVDKTLLDWTSDDKTSNGKTYHFRIRFVQHLQAQQQSQIKVEIISGGLVRGFFTPNQFDTPVCNRYQWSGSLAIVQGWDAAYWGTTSATSDTLLRAALWSEL